jgi:hypothetical protein
MRKNVKLILSTRKFAAEASSEDVLSARHPLVIRSSSAHHPLTAGLIIWGQGDQIGRIFAYSAIVFVGQFC